MKCYFWEGETSKPTIKTSNSACTVDFRLSTKPGIPLSSPLSCSEVSELQNKWFNVLLKDTSAGQTLADSVARIQLLRMKSRLCMHRPAASRGCDATCVHEGGRRQNPPDEWPLTSDARERFSLGFCAIERGGCNTTSIVSVTYWNTQTSINIHHWKCELKPN